MNEFHEGPWSVVPLDNMNSGDEAAKILDWILLNIPNDIDEPLDWYTKFINKQNLSEYIFIMKILLFKNENL